MAKTNDRPLLLKHACWLWILSKVLWTSWRRPLRIPGVALLQGTCLQRWRPGVPSCFLSLSCSPGWCLGAVPVKSRCDARGICDKTVCRAKQTQHWCVGLSQGKQCAGAGLLARAGTREPRSLTQRELRREVAADPRIQELISQRGHWKALAFWEMSPNAS